MKNRNGEYDNLRNLLVRELIKNEILGKVLSYSATPTTI